MGGGMEGCKQMIMINRNTINKFNQNFFLFWHLNLRLIKINLMGRGDERLLKALRPPRIRPPVSS